MGNGLVTGKPDFCRKISYHSTTTMETFEELLARIGIGISKKLQIQFGGIVGKTALVAISVAGSLAVVASRTHDPGVLYACVCALFLIAILTVGWILLYGHKHPMEATLEGAEIVAWQHVQHEQQAAKDLKKIPSPSPPLLEGVGTKPAKELPSSENKEESI